MARVLLADDDAAMRDLVCRSLSAEGHTVVVAHDGQEALDLAHSAAAPFDILVTDVQMPGVDGIALANQMLELNQGLKVVLMSGLQSEMARAGGLEDARGSIHLQAFHPRADPRHRALDAWWEVNPGSGMLPRGGCRADQLRR